MKGDGANTGRVRDGGGRKGFFEPWRAFIPSSERKQAGLAADGGEIGGGRGGVATPSAVVTTGGGGAGVPKAGGAGVLITTTPAGTSVVVDSSGQMHQTPGAPKRHREASKNFKAAFDLSKAGYFGPEDKESLRSCVQAINFCTTDCKGELQGFVLDKLKEPKDELLSKLESELKEALEDFDDHPLIVNLKRLYELQLSKAVHIECLFQELSKAVEKFRSTNEEVISFLLLNMYLHLSWSLHSIVNREDPSMASLSSLCSERDTLLKHLGYFLNSSQCEDEVKVGNQLAFRVCLILADVWYLFRKANFSSENLETLGFAPDQSAFKHFRQLCEQQLNISNENEEEDLSKDYTDLTKPDKILLAAGKLIVTDTAPMEYLGLDLEVIPNLIGTSAAEIVKAVLRNKVDICDMCFGTLKRAYRRHQNEVSSANEKSAQTTLLDCKTRSVQLCEIVMDCEGSKHIPDILKVVMKCVEYAFINIPNHLSFLECGVVDFVSKLPIADVIDILKDVQGRGEKINIDDDPSGCRHYLNFLDILQEFAGISFGRSMSLEIQDSYIHLLIFVEQLELAFIMMVVISSVRIQDLQTRLCEKKIPSQKT